MKTPKSIRLFAVWCSREALKLYETPDQRYVKAVDVAERFANGQATQEQLDATYDQVFELYAKTIQNGSTDNEREYYISKLVGWSVCTDQAIPIRDIELDFHNLFVRFSNDSFFHHDEMAAQRSLIDETQ